MALLHIHDPETMWAIVLSHNTSFLNSVLVILLRHLLITDDEELKPFQETNIRTSPCCNGLP